MWESSKFPVENSFASLVLLLLLSLNHFCLLSLYFQVNIMAQNIHVFKTNGEYSDCCLNILNFYHFALVFVVVLSSVYSNSILVQALTNMCMCSIQVSLWKSNQNGQSKLNGSYKHCSFNSILNGFSLSLHCFYFDCHTLVIKRCFNILFLRSIKLHISPLE